MTAERLDKLLSRLGYCSRRDTRQWCREERITIDGIAAGKADMKVDATSQTIQVDGESLDHPLGLYVAYHKPEGYICSHNDAGLLIYQHFPEQWLHRTPRFASIGRLDQETSGLLLLTDDGAFSQFASHPKRHIAKIYVAALADPLRGDEAKAFASGTLMLHGEDTPCQSAQLHPLDDTTAEVTVYEGRYHQVRRMFAAVGHKVVGLQRQQIGNLTLENAGAAGSALAPGAYNVFPDRDALAGLLKEPT